MISRVHEQLKKTQSCLLKVLANSYCSYMLTNNGSPSTEATAWGAISLMEDYPFEARKAIDFLIAKQNNDGGWSTVPALGKSDWTTAAATLAIRLFAQKQHVLVDQRQIKRVITNAFHFLVKSRFDFLTPVARLLLLLRDGPESLNYGRGWPWTAGTCNWVEPSAYCLMAIKTPFLASENLAKPVVFHANKFLLDHMCRSGGWNHGSYYCLGQYYKPYLVPTAEALLALVDIKDHPKVRESLNYLIQVKHEYPSAMALAWSIMALDAYGQSYENELHLLLEQTNEDGSFGSNYFVTAIACLALNVVNGINPFRRIQL